MPQILKKALAICFGFSSGAVISSAVFAFIAAIGIIPRMAQKAGAKHNIRIFETSVMLGGLVGCGVFLFKPQLSISGLLGIIILASIGLTAGIFYGALVMSLAEVLDVIPIAMRRAGLTKGLRIIILAIAFGKMMGALIFFLTPYFN